MCVSKAHLEGGRVVGKYPTPGPCKIGGCAMSRTHKAGKCHTVAWGGWAQLELTDA